MLRYYFDLTPQRKNMVADVQWNYTECPDLHDHDHWEYLIITNGVCRNNINGSDYIMNKGDAVLIKPSDRHYLINADKKGPPFAHINLIMRDSEVHRFCDGVDETLYQRLYDTPPCVLTFSGSDYNRAIDYATTFLSQKFVNDNCSMIARLFICFVLEKTASRLFIEDSRYPEWIYAILRKINNPAYADIFPKTILASSPYSHTYTSKIFKQCTGQTLSDYINQVKMVKACELLTQSNLSTLEIANMLGFYSLSYFNHIFKKTYGVAPRQYHNHSVNGPAPKK